jgi:signal transduction histidine kinase/ActR/RegA family two-component response regulator
MIGVSAVGLFTLAPLFSSYAALIIPLLLPTGIVLLASGTTPGLWWGITLLVFMVVALSNGRRYNRNLVDSLRLRYELERSAIDLEAARDAAEAASQAKSEFLAVMSHEVRTPIAGIIGMADLLLEREKDARNKMYLNGLLRSALNLKDIVNDILDLSKIEAGHMEIEAVDFDPRTLVSDAVVVYRELAAQKGLRLECRVASDLPDLVRGDPGRIRQVLHNLLGNALKFTEEGQVTVKVTHMGNLDGKITIRFSVQDTGIGIPHEKQARIFDTFTQADSSHSRRFGGTGLGLAISRQLAELMGGTIDVASTPERGSTFWFTVRLDDATQPETTEPVTEAGKGVRRLGGRILLVDDNESNRMMVREMLAERGVECLEAKNGEEAILAVASMGELDVILMDCQMPLMDGYEATRHIRAWEDTDGGAGTRPVPIIAMTANASTEDRARCLETGMNDYLAKPFRMAELFEMLEKWLSPSPEEGLRRA